MTVLCSLTAFSSFPSLGINPTYSNDIPFRNRTMALLRFSNTDLASSSCSTMLTSNLKEFVPCFVYITLIKAYASVMEVGSDVATTMRSSAAILKYMTFEEIPAPVSINKISNSSSRASNSFNKLSFWPCVR